MREYRYPRGYREDEELYVYDQCCANCARQSCDCPFEDDVDRESTPGAKKQNASFCLWKKEKRAGRVTKVPYSWGHHGSGTNH